MSLPLICIFLNPFLFKDSIIVTKYWYFVSESAEIIAVFISGEIDFSGSNVEIYDSNFENVKDKLISGGEESNIKISKIYAVNSKSGIISKDGSKVYAKDIFFNNVQIPFAAYQKKTEYDYGLLAVNDFKIDNFLIKFAKDDKSKITLNNITQINIKDNKEGLSLVNQ